MNTPTDASIPAVWPIPRVGIIGVGNMGGAMAARLLSQGYLVAVHDIDAQREAHAVSMGAMACATATGLGSSSDVVIVAVVDAAQAQQVLFGAHGAVASLAPGSAVFLCPTIAPADTERIAEALEQRGIDWLDAPMSGGPERARDGSMSLMLACSNAVLERHRRLVEVLSSKVFHIGERPGDGARTKLVNNLVAGINLVGAAEGLALAERLGLNIARTLAVIEQSSGQSWIGSDRMRRAIHGDYLPRAHTSLLRKDTQIAIGVAGGTGLATKVGEQAAAVFARACERGLAGMDDASVFELLRRD
jgi:3-hydroxyisobutyrate dehydrogenase